MNIAEFQIVCPDTGSLIWQQAQAFPIDCTFAGGYTIPYLSNNSSSCLPVLTPPAVSLAV